jgi:hypothetical protein
MAPETIGNYLSVNGPWALIGIQLYIILNLVGLVQKPLSDYARMLILLESMTAQVAHLCEDVRDVGEALRLLTEWVAEQKRKGQ